MGRNHVTLQTIADRLGVSRTTVSNAYNRPDQLAPELREKVLATAAELGYVGPDPAARRLRSGRREAIGLLFTESLSYAFTDPAAVLFIQGLARATEEAGLAVLVIPSTRGGPAGDRTGGVADAVVDAFCLYSMPDDHPDVQAVIQRRLPTVVVDEPRLPSATFIGIEDLEGARLSGEHLVGLGHRDIGVLTFRTADDGYVGPMTPEREAAAVYAVERDRVAGYREALEAGGLAWAQVPKQECMGNSVEEGAAAARALLERAPDITAMLCTTDQMAFGAIAMARELGRRVPEDLSVVGFDDVPAAAASDLTTIRQPLAEKGHMAGRLIVEGQAAPGREVRLPVELVVRGSTAPPSR